MNNKAGFHKYLNLFTLCILFFCNLISAQTSLKIVYHDQSTEIYHVSATGRIISEDSIVKIFTDANATPVAIPFSVIRKLDYTPLSSNDEVSGKLSQIRIFPNPADQYFIVKDGDRQLFELNMYSILGQQVVAGKFNCGERIPVKDVKPGVYVVLINEHAMKIIVR